MYIYPVCVRDIDKEQDEEVGEWLTNNSTHSLSHLVNFSFKFNVFLCVTEEKRHGNSRGERERGGGWER